MIILENRYSMLWTFSHFGVHVCCTQCFCDIPATVPDPYPVSSPCHRAESDGFQSSFEVDSISTMFSEKKTRPGARWRCTAPKPQRTCEYMRRAGSSCPGAANWKSPLSPVRGFRRSAWGLGMTPLRAAACARAERAAYSRTRCRATIHTSHATIHTRPSPTAGANQDRSTLNRHARCVPRRRAPPGGLPSVAVRSIIHRRASNKIAQAEQLPHLLINDGAHDECGHEAQAVDAPTSIEAEWAICAPNVSDALQRACR